MEYFHRIIAAGIFVNALFILSACGGGGGNGNNVSAAVTPTPTSTIAPLLATIPIAQTSYQNAKGLNIPPQRLPDYTYDNVAHAFADFFQHGQLDLFVARITYDPTQPISMATKGSFEFWKRQPDGSFIQDTTLLADTTGCIHPRKAIVADFNHSGKPSIFVACTGYDNVPFPGEDAAIILSQPDGTYKTTFIPYNGYFHGAAAADLTGNGNMDVVAVNPNTNGIGHTPVIFVNDGKGNFSVRTDLLPQFQPGQLFYTVEALDLNGDGKPDLIFMGDDTCPGNCPQLAAPPTIAYNNGSGTFTNSALNVLPPIPGSFVLDAVFLNNILYLSRTGGDKSLASWYSTQVIQAIDLADNNSTILVNNTTVPGQNKWIEWLLPYSVNGHTSLVSDDLAIPFSYKIN